MLLLAFLLGAIVLTVWVSNDVNLVGRYNGVQFAGETEPVTAEVITPENKRESRLEQLRKKLANFTDVALAPRAEEVAVIDNETDTATTTVTTATVPASTVKLCSNYHVASLPQLSGGLIYKESEGQRVFSVTETLPSESTTTPPTVTQRTVFLLPLRTAEQGVTDCVGATIVAVTPTGLPILNTEALKYSGSGEGTLIGYTLDGLTLYGRTTSIATDECGGATVGGVYRYYISPERETILNCFVAIPVAI